MPDLLKAVIGSLRLPFLALTPACLAIGFAAAIYLHGELDTGLASLVLLGGLAAHISANTLNEYLDYTSGLDLVTSKTPFSGGSGSIPKYPQSNKAVLAVSLVALVITILVGAYLGSIKGWPVWLIGLAGVALITLYTRVINRQPWLCLVSPGLAFGPLFVLGAYISVTQAVNISTFSLLSVFIASLLPFFLVNNLLLLNQVPDIEADAQVGRVTLPVKYGPETAARVYVSGMGLGSVCISAGAALGLLPLGSLFVLPVLLVGARIYTVLIRSQGRLPEIFPLLGANVAMTLAAIMLLALVLVSWKPA